MYSLYEPFWTNFVYRHLAGAYLYKFIKISHKPGNNYSRSVEFLSFIIY